MKCIACGETMTKKEFENRGTYANRGEYDGKPIHEDCETDDVSEPIASIVHFLDGYKYQASIGEYCVQAFDGDDDLVREISDGISYHKTDGWRGYYDGETPVGFVKMLDTWFCGFDGHNLNDDDYSSQLQKKFNDDEIPPVELILVFYRTSNAFSMCLNVYVRPKDKVKLIKWLTV
jgi:hypothetical protein